MINEEELNENIKKHMKEFSTKDLKIWREKLTKLGKLDNEMLALLNEELLERACQNIEVEDQKEK